MENPLIPTAVDIALIALTLAVVATVIVIVGTLLRIGFLTTAALRARNAVRRITRRPRS